MTLQLRLLPAQPRTVSPEEWPTRSRCLRLQAAATDAQLAAQGMAASDRAEHTLALRTLADRCEREATR